MEIRVGGKYSLSKKLGEGAFGEVFLGTNIKTGENVAIKLVSFRIMKGAFIKQIPIVSLRSKTLQNAD